MYERIEHLMPDCGECGIQKGFIKLATGKFVCANCMKKNLLNEGVLTECQ